MREAGELTPEIDRCEPFSEARAIMDFCCHGKTTTEWIVSHERLRRELSKVESQRDALQRQIDGMQKELHAQAGLKSQLENARRQSDSLRKQLEELQVRQSQKVEAAV